MLRFEFIVTLPAWLPAVAGVALLLAGCGVRQVEAPAAAGGGRTAAARTTHAELQLVGRRLLSLPDPAASPAPPLEARPDCPEAWQLVERICLLSDRICRLATEAPGDKELAQLCAEDRPRCPMARELVERSCPRPPG